MRWIGHEIHAEAVLDVDAATTLWQAHDLAHRAEAALVRATPRLTTAVIHAYPAHHDELVQAPAELSELEPPGRASPPAASNA